MAQYVNIMLETDIENRVAVITINRADKLNALNRALLEELDSALDTIADDDNVRALIITGAGNRAFVAGADIAEIAALRTAEDAKAFSRHGQKIFSKIEQLPKPVVVAVNGYALGGGCELAMSGDIRLAADTAQFGQPEINLGVIPGYGGTQRLARIIGRDRAKYLVFTGERIGADEAFRLGLVERIVPGVDLLDAAMELAKSLAAKAPQALALAKMAINEGASMPLEEALEHEAALFAQAADTADRREGTSAFLEKRQPQWRGV
jgi:enoyl-CoA hydratase